MRLIDADNLKGYFPKDEDWDYPVNTNSEVVRIIDEAPTVDAVKVVRCKDCKFAHLTYAKEAKYCDYWKDDDDFFIKVYLPSDHYCAWGEKRDEID